MSYEDNIDRKNIAESLGELLPKAQVLDTTATEVPGLHIFHVAAPKGTDVKRFEVDLEKYLGSPRETNATAKFTDIPSYLAYIKRHAVDGSVVWCHFNPQTYELAFTAVFDEHTKDAAGWRRHRALLVPDFSTEWKDWKGKDKSSFAQLAFAEWIQEHEDDINSEANGLPTSLQMLQMATEFAVNEERVLKSTMRLQSGGVRLTYIADPDSGSTENMQMFEKFAIGIPVFQGGAAWSITARLKYRLSNGKVSFFYELVRPDRVHKGAAADLIQQVSDGLGSVPLLQGTCN